MIEYLKNLGISLFAGFGGAFALFAFIKSIIKKWVESTIDQQMQKTLADYQKSIDRQNSSYNLRLQREFDYFDFVQLQQQKIVSNTEVLLSYIREKNAPKIVTTYKTLLEQLEGFVEKYKTNEAYLNENIRVLVRRVCSHIPALASIITSVNSPLEIDYSHFAGVSELFLNSCEEFRVGLIDYIVKNES